MKNDGERSTSRRGSSPGPANVAESIPSEKQNRPTLPKRSVGEIPPAGGVQLSISKIAATKVLSVESTADARRESSVRMSSETVHLSPPSANRETLSPAQIHPLSRSDGADASATLDRAFEASPCSVSSPPPSSSSQPLPSSTEPSSSEPAPTTTDTDPKGDPNLALFDEAIYLCRRFVKLVEDGRKKRREVAESRRREGGE